MKKTIGKTLAFLLVACVLAAGTFVSCGEQETEEPTAAESLAKPVGSDPLTAGLYKAVITTTYTDENGESKALNSPAHCAVDTKNRIITFYQSEEELLENAYQQKYTYAANTGTVSLAYYCFAVPNDVNAYLSTLYSDEAYKDGWQLGKHGDYDDYIAYNKQLIQYSIATITELLNNENLSDEERKVIEKSLATMEQRLENYDKTFNDMIAKAITYDYTKDDDSITLTNATATPNKLVLTPANN